MALKLKKVAYVMLYVADMERALGFYRDQLGLEVGFAEANWAELQTEGFTLALHLSDKPVSQPDPAPCVIFAASDLVAERQALQALDIPVSPLHKVAEYDEIVGASVDFKDPDGNALSLYASLPRSVWEEISRA
ncbi:MAG: hypothetical protein CVV27_05965 [Candidatus Melainabacteria bacterium HGW-Melainabacteria-1]|nr:MAG: hypothetical protein CVV27_05965 [Candidatus Melainabacteria bacterium HGW-Melainabacteria-1]